LGVIIDSRNQSRNRKIAQAMVLFDTEVGNDSIDGLQQRFDFVGTDIEKEWHCTRFSCAYPD